MTLNFRGSLSPLAVRHSYKPTKMSGSPSWSKVQNLRHALWPTAGILNYVFQ